MRSDWTTETAWDAVHEALPARWRVGPITFDAGAVSADSFLGAFKVTARGPHPGRGKMPQTVTGTGSTEIGALRALGGRLRGVPQPDGGQMDHLRQRLRLAFVQGAEGWSHEYSGRGLSNAELDGVLTRYRGR